MKIIYRCLLFTLLVCSLLSCKKEFERHCWQLIDQTGNQIARPCNITEAELLNKYSSYFGGAGLQPCNYYIDDGDKFCWVSQTGNRLENMNEYQIALYSRCFFPGSVFQKASCDCANWYKREKRLYKPSNLTSYSNITRRRYCGDSANASYHQPYIRKDDADSLITIQVSSDGINFR